MPDAEEGEPGAIEPADEVVDGEIHDGPGGRHRLIAERSFSGPLPEPDALREYEQVSPGLADIIVSQWQAETAHRHKTIDGLRQTDHEAMEHYYEGERRGQWIALIAFGGILAVIVAALILGSDEGAIGGLLIAAGTVIWAFRRRSSPDPTPDGSAEIEDAPETLSRDE